MNKIDISKQSELIDAIFDLSGLERITADRRKINEAFFRLKKEFPQYFESLMFNTNWQFPISNDLNDILSRFMLSGIIRWQGCKYYKLHKNKQYNERIKKQFPDIDIVEMQKIADKFREYMG